MDLLDTDVLIDVQRGHPPAVAWFASLTALPSVPGLVAMELVQDARNAQEVRKAQALVVPMQLVWPNEAECTTALSNFATLHLSHVLGLLDSLIAACAVGRGARLCTFNTKHYAAIPSLVTLQPYVK
jgi:predicted nucleic acid-binding protein